MRPDISKKYFRAQQVAQLEDAPDITIEQKGYK